MHRAVEAIALVIACVLLATVSGVLFYLYMESLMKRHAFVLGLLFCVAMALLVGFARAQEHHHPPQDAAIHEKFYRDWMRPDDRRYSCCNDKDCAPVHAAEYRDGAWWAQRASDLKWLRIPPEKIERERDSPDPWPHMCSIGDTVFCFIAPGGV